MTRAWDAESRSISPLTTRGWDGGGFGKYEVSKTNFTGDVADADPLKESALHDEPEVWCVQPRPKRIARGSTRRESDLNSLVGSEPLAEAPRPLHSREHDAEVDFRFRSGRQASIGWRRRRSLEIAESELAKGVDKPAYITSLPTFGRPSIQGRRAAQPGEQELGLPPEADGYQHLTTYGDQPLPAQAIANVGDALALDTEAPPKAVPGMLAEAADTAVGNVFVADWRGKPPLLQGSLHEFWSELESHPLRDAAVPPSLVDFLRSQRR